ncbi:sugar ABC transporter permease [Paenibacillus sp.]|uniref:carbohydrate ABC transporter permease n=1 Tax=Paenibacillus sp. TaxID=58172 RepID=UPI002D41A4DC|nr:sugar ABC transporter permease [Paenibacillus sp.]HZG83370.1 sugar ABC transporter permease [Paenibacillus sp.]
MKQRLSYFVGPTGAAYVFLLPAMAIFFIFMVIPLIASLVMGLFSIDIFLKNIKFVGLDNFTKLLGDDRFWNSLKNTLYFTVLEMPLQVAVGLIAAVLLSKPTKFRKALRTTYFIPVVCSLTAMGILWSMLLDPNLGMIPYFFEKLGFPKIAFLKEPNLAMPTVAVMSVWKNFGFTMVILLAGIQGISESYYEAAEIDGASKMKQFFHITIPLLIPALSFCIITNTIGCLQVFDQVYVMTQGGPLFRTETIVQYIYNAGFTLAPFDLGYASAIAEVLLVIIVVITLLMHRFFAKRETTEF